ncbi:uncharacterized protein LOC17882933 isoform X2 [Capsella rubella]|uniref:uncharacterized protein LOC17882933 isoform X2 n=1 Tax=Capsella rubella TaxID=81985 RepID=UPI000CD595AD|nr:uncharacterized protein LOC17882933 isoform X2 [Capsella rubella]
MTQRRSIYLIKKNIRFYNKEKIPHQDSTSKPPTPANKNPNEETQPENSTAEFYTPTEANTQTKTEVITEKLDQSNEMNTDEANEKTEEITQKMDQVDEVITQIVEETDELTKNMDPADKDGEEEQEGNQNEEDGSLEPSFDLGCFSSAEEKKRKWVQKRKDNKLKKKHKVDVEKMIIRRSQRLTTPSMPIISPYRATRNPATTTLNPSMNPFLSPTLKNDEEMTIWRNANIQTGKITDREPLTPHWLSIVEKPEAHLQETHIDAAMLTIWFKRERDPVYFHNKRLPKSIFVNTGFLRVLIECYHSFKKDNLKTHYKFPKRLLDTINGKSPSISSLQAAWHEVDNAYGIAYCKEINQHIGIKVSFSERKITVFDCRSDNYKADMIKSHVFPYAEMIPYLLAWGKGPKPVNLSSFKVSTPKRFTCRIKHDGNCAIFLLKMIECHAIGVEDMMNKLDEAFSEDTRARIAYDIYKEIIVKDVDMFRE